MISYADDADGVLVTARRTADSPESDQVLVLCRPPGLELEQVGEWNALGFRGTCSTGFVLRATGDVRSVLDDPYADISTRTMLPAAHLLWSLGVAGHRLGRRRAGPQVRPGRGPPQARHDAAGRPPPGRGDRRPPAVHRHAAVVAGPLRGGRHGRRSAVLDRIRDRDELPQGVGLHAGRRHRPRVHAHLRPGLVPAGHAVQPGPAPARRDGCRPHGQQRPDHGQQRADAPRPAGGSDDRGRTRTRPRRPDAIATQSRGRSSGGPAPRLPASCWPRRSTASTDGRPPTSRSSTPSTGWSPGRVPTIGATQPPVPTGHALGHVREERLPRVVPRPDGVGPHRSGATREDHAELLRRTEAHEDRGPLLETTDMVLCPAVCHPLYPTQSGILPEGGRTGRGRTATASATSRAPTRSGCSPSGMHDFVYLGTPDGARAHRDHWIEPGPRRAHPASGSRSSRSWPTTRSSADPAGCWRPTSDPRSSSSSS